LISIRSAPNQIAENVSVLTELIQNTSFSDEAVEATRQQILEEQRQQLHNSCRLVLENLHATAYQESGLGHPTMGPSENMKSFTPKDLQTFASNYYNPANVSVIGVGAVQHESLVRAVEMSFGSSTSSSSSPPSNKKGFGQTPYIGSMVTVQDDFLPFTKYAIGLKGVGVNHPHYLPLAMLSYAFHPSFNRNVAGGIAISPRYTRIVSEEQQASFIEPFFFSYSDTGIFGVFFESEPDKPFDSIWELLNNYHRVTHDLRSAEFARAKSLFRSQLVKNDTSSNITDEIARLNLREGQTRKSLQDKIKEIDALSLGQAQQIFDEYTNDIEPTISACGNLLHFPDYNYVRSWTSWRRL